MPTNTKETLGVQGTLDKLTAYKLEELVDDFSGALGAYALYMNTGLKKITLPCVTKIGAYAFYRCANLLCADIGGSPCTIDTYAFNECSEMNALILRGSTVASLSSYSCLEKTKIMSGNGGIYVPADLVSSYKSESNWSVFSGNIFPISEYPRTDFSTISDSWSEIFAAEADGTYADKYSVGDTKALEINGTTIYMQIAAMDSDVLSDGTGNAKITWLCKNAYTKHHLVLDNDTTGGWESSEMRRYLRDSVLTSIPEAVRGNIKAVDKTYFDPGSESTLTISDSIWIPSHREVCYGTPKESAGVQYSTLFTGNYTRIRCDSSGATSNWILRTIDSGRNPFYMVYNGGSVSNVSTNSELGVVFGFCT